LALAGQPLDLLDLNGKFDQRLCPCRSARMGFAVVLRKGRDRVGELDGEEAPRVVAVRFETPDLRGKARGAAAVPVDEQVWGLGGGGLRRLAAGGCCGPACTGSRGAGSETCEEGGATGQSSACGHLARSPP